VIKTGIRMISLSYSKISLHDISEKLKLGSEEDAEFIVAKVAAPFLLFSFLFFSSNQRSID